MCEIGKDTSYKYSCNNNNNDEYREKNKIIRGKMYSGN